MDKKFLEKGTILAAQCWCEETTSHLEMDANLAEVIAYKMAVLMEETYISKLEVWIAAIKNMQLSLLHKTDIEPSKIEEIGEEVILLFSRLKNATQD